MTALLRLGDGRAELTRGPDAPATAVPLDGFAEVLTLRWCDDRQELLAVAVPAGAAAPAAGAGDRGDVRAFRWRPGADGWDEVFGGYTHDVVCLPGGAYAVHTGTRLALLRDGGEAEREVKLGRFSWGPPALTRSPGGDRLAWVRWRGDTSRLCTMRVEDGSPREHGGCARYAWLDDRRLVFFLHGPLRVVDAETGRAGVLLKSVTAAAAGRRFGDRTLDRYLSGRVRDVEESFHAVRAADGRVWFGVMLMTLSFRWWWLRPFSGVFSVDTDGGDLRLELPLPKRELLDDVVAVDDGRVIVVERRSRRGDVELRRHAVGALREFLADGWTPLPTNSDPLFFVRGLR